LSGCSVGKLIDDGVYEELESTQYEALINRGGINIIDVRTKSEYNASHIEGAINASYFSGGFLKLVAQHHLDANKITLIYCETQHRSPMAAKRLYKAGFSKIIDLKKGMSKWRKEGFPFKSNILESE
jgi:rhodanese-related sulfurtransferase